MIFGGDGGTVEFDDPGTFVPGTVPAPGLFLDGHAVLDGDAHVAVHEESRDRFERFGVYDATFGYNLAKLNRDTRHPEAGFRYGVDPERPDVLRVEFTPTTAFCPQSTTLTRGVFRAWNATDSAFRLVSVRVDPMHQRSEATNDRLRELEAHYEETGEVVDEAGASDAVGASGFDPGNLDADGFDADGLDDEAETDDEADTDDDEAETDDEADTDDDAGTESGGLSAPW
ncbi:MAG: hypothetical protein ABEH81_02060 [Halopenitus sp.]